MGSLAINIRDLLHRRTIEGERIEFKGTGFPKIQRAMKRNGSLDAVFSTDEGRTHFLATLPVHPVMVGMIGSLRPGEGATQAVDWMDRRAAAIGHALTERQREILRVLAKNTEMTFGDVLRAGG